MHTSYLGYIQVEPTFHHEKVNSQTTESIAEGKTAYYICNATIPVSSFLAWKGRDNKTVPTMKLITPLNSITHDVTNMCQTYAQEWLSEMIINNSTMYTTQGLVSQQIIALVVCNMKSSIAGVYQCIAQSYMGEVTIGAQISIDIAPSVSSPSHSLVPYLIMGGVLIAIFLLVAVSVIVITHFWFRYQSKRLKYRDHSAGTCRKREENIYFDVRLHKEH
jgi:hypothetical protein